MVRSRGLTELYRYLYCSDQKVAVGSGEDALDGDFSDLYSANPDGIYTHLVLQTGALGIYVSTPDHHDSYRKLRGMEKAETTRSSIFLLHDDCFDGFCNYSPWDDFVVHP